MTHEIYERFDTFLKKLEARANDVISQAKPQIPEIYASDEDFYKRSFELFKNNLTGELHSLIRKAETVFSTQIIPFEQQSGLIESRAAKHYSKKFEDWKDRLEFRIDALFENFQPKKLEDLYEQAVSDLDEINEKIACQSCGSKMHMDTIYTISKYISCPFCGAQNIFTPSQAMRELALDKMRISQAFQKNYKYPLE